MSHTPEEWRSVPEHPDYEASSLGRVKSLFFKNHHSRVFKPRILKGGLRPNGYLKVFVDGMQLSVHRLVCMTFHGPCPEGMECRHLNGHKNDCRSANLAWGPRRVNQIDCIRHGRAKYNKLTQAQVAEIKLNRNNDSHRATAAQYGVHETTIGNARNGKTWNW